MGGDEEDDEKVTAYVVLKGGVPESQEKSDEITNQLVNYISEHLAEGQEMADGIRFVGQLPRNAFSKINKAMLKKLKQPSVEEIIMSHDYVCDAQVVNDENEDKLKAQVVLQEGVPDNEKVNEALMKQVQDRLVQGQKAPDEIKFVPKLPRNAFSKIDKSLFSQLKNPSVEDILSKHPDVRENCVMDVVEEDGEKLNAWVVLKDGVPDTEEKIEAKKKELFDHIKENVKEGQKIPQDIKFVPYLPRNAQSKINKNVLKDAFAETALKQDQKRNDQIEPEEFDSFLVDRKIKDDQKEPNEYFKQQDTEEKDRLTYKQFKCAYKSLCKKQVPVTSHGDEKQEGEQQKVGKQGTMVLEAKEVEALQSLQTFLDFSKQAIQILNMQPEKIEQFGGQIYTWVKKMEEIAGGVDNHNLDQWPTHRFFEKIGEPLTRHEFKAKFESIDIDGDKQMSMVEFLIYKFDLSPQELLKATNDELIKSSCGDTESVGRKYFEDMQRKESEGQRKFKKYW